MQPLELKMTAFGPYKDCETIDFRALGDRKLFVISGTTGAGKTTIFDGIFYALYGAASGEDRSEVKGLRSHFADDKVATSVELLFAMKGHTYRVYRQLPYKKAGNKSETPGKVELYEVTDQGDVPLVDQQKATEVSDKIRELLGLTKEQFKQIVMLPQGEFQKLLTSTTANKEEILRKIFKTMKYDDMVHRLKDKRNDAQQALDKAQALQQHTVRTIHQALPLREASSLEQLLAQEHFTTARLVQALAEEQQHYEALLPGQQQAYEEAMDKQNALQEMRAKARQFNEELTTYQNLKTELTKLNEQQPAIDTMRKQYDFAEKAQQLAPYDEQFHTLNQHKKKLENRLPALQEKLADAIKKHEEITLQWQQVTEDKKQLPVLEQQLRTWQPLIAMYERVDDSKARQQTLQQQLQRHQQQVQKNHHEQQQVMATFETQKAQYTQAMEAVHALPMLQQQLFDEEKKVNAYTQFTQRKTQLQTLAKALQEAKKEQQQAQTAYETMHQISLRNQAYTLAQQLVEGEACPVCGSADHPAHAQLSDAVDEQVLEQQRVQYEATQRMYYRAESAWQSAQLQLNEATAACDALAIDTTRTYTTTRYEHIKAQVAQLMQAQTKAEQQQQTLQQLEQQLKQFEQQQQTLQQQLIVTEQQLQTNTVLLEEQQQQLPEQYGTKAELQQYLTAVEHQKIQLEQRVEAVRQQLEQATQTLQLTKNDHVHLTTQIDEAVHNLQEAQEHFKERVLEHFDNGQHYTEMKHFIPQMPSMRMKLEQFAQQLYATTQACEKRQHLEGKEPHDMATIEAQLQQARQQGEQLFTNWQQTKSYVKNTQALMQQLDENRAQIEALEQRATHIIALYDLLRGNNEQRISFERYLQIEYLEQIIEAANERLQPLSNGQFLLQRSERLESHGKQSGLGLDIYDAYTGQTRDVKTMSGGEKFNAALCLALGISDIIQSYRGQVEIDTMFIDEGFGTLDEEALAKAIDTLVELQKSGRMIGVISHVAGLKEAIPAVLEVKKLREGYSHTKFHID
ncbi:MAG TPA: SMC family ATPase [Candidatus Kurthia intestinigallinarum]|nr:SMC family ATPase [Candidatus Kurthia intestinigallinarum]